MAQLADAPHQLHFEGVLEKPLFGPSAHLAADPLHAYDEDQRLFEVFDVQFEPVDVLQVLVELGRQLLEFGQLVLEHEQYLVIILFLNLHLFLVRIDPCA